MASKLPKNAASPPKPQCKAEGCENAAKARGYCYKHYMRAVRCGDIEKNPRRGRHATYGEEELSQCIDMVQKTIDERKAKAGVNRGNSVTYLAARLHRDHPLIFARLKSGEFTTIHAAACEAGIVRKPQTIIAQFERLWTNASDHERSKIAALIRKSKQLAP